MPAPDSKLPKQEASSLVSATCERHESAGQHLSSRKKKYRIFVVDPEYILASTLGEILRGEGYEATSFTEPILAMQAVSFEPPDLIISSVVMPHISGTELGIRVQENCPNCKVLLWSADPDATNLLSAAEASGHCFEVIAKPVHPTYLLKKIREMIEGAPSPSLSSSLEEKL